MTMTPAYAIRSNASWLKTTCCATFLAAALTGCGGGATVPPSAVDVAHGRVIRWEAFPSQHVDARDIDIWVPDGVFSADERQDGFGGGDSGPEGGTDSVKVLFMHDGQMLFDSTSTWNGQEWGVDESVGGLIEEGRLGPVIVVAIPNNGGKRYAEYFPEGVLERMGPVERERVIGRMEGGRALGDAYVRFLAEELLPEVERQFPVLPGAENRVVMGSSMGGLISLYAALERPEVFGRVGAVSTHWPMVTGELLEQTAPENPYFDAMLSYLDERIPHASAGSHVFYYDYGTETLDSQYAPYQKQVDQLMLGKGYSLRNWRSLMFPGAAHDEASWAERLRLPLQVLAGPDHYRY